MSDALFERESRSRDEDIGAKMQARPFVALRSYEIPEWANAARMGRSLPGRGRRNRPGICGQTAEAVREAAFPGN